MHLLGLAVLACCSTPVPEGFQDDPRISKADIRMRYVPKYRKKWREIFGLPAISDPFYVFLSYADPQPVEKFIPFRRERLSKKFLEDSGMWLEDIFREGANPLAKGVRPCKYFAGGQGESDLLLYRWATHDYRLKMQESCRGFLLHVQSKDRPFDIQKGVPDNKVVAALRSLLNLKDAVPKGQTVAQAFHLPKILTKGVPFDNISRDDHDYKESPTFFAKYPPRWSQCIVGFLGNDGLYLLICKGGGLASPELLFSPNWLRDGLFGPDGKTRVLKRRPDIEYREK